MSPAGIVSNPAQALRVRAGVNAREPIAEDEDVFGASVNLAARICGEARPGHVLVSSAVYELAAGKDFKFEEHGDIELRGVAEPVRLLEIVW